MCQTSFGDQRFGGGALGDAGMCYAAAHAPAQLTRDTGGPSSRYQLSCRGRWLMWDGRRIVDLWHWTRNPSTPRTAGMCPIARCGFDRPLPVE